LSSTPGSVLVDVAQRLILEPLPNHDNSWNGVGGARVSYEAKYKELSKAGEGPFSMTSL
jgi:hypothetical protein